MTPTEPARCTACDRELTPGARFCPRCGAAVASQPTRDELLAQAERARAEARARSGAGGSVPRASEAVPPAHRTQAPEAVQPAPDAEPSADHEPTDVLHVGPMSRHDASRSSHDDHAPAEHDGPAPTFTPGRVAAMVATFVALTVLGTWTLSQLFGSTPDGAPDPTGAATAGSTVSSPPPSPSGSRSGSAPADAAPEPRLADAPKRCSTSGSDEVATAWSGNRDTSCAFSDAVRAAYRKAGAPDGSEPFRTYSTVTKKWYDVTCLTTEATPPVRCHSADGNAVVFLGP